MLRLVNNKLVSNFDLVGDVFAADLVGAETQGAALLGTGGALAPADGTVALGVEVARRVAESATLLLVLVADQGRASTTVVRALGARDTNVGHALGAVRGADAAADGVEFLVALGEPEVAPHLAAGALMHLTGTSAVSIRFVAVGTVVTEASLVGGAVLPADGANASEAILASVVAKSTVLLLASRAVGEGLASSAAIGLLPAGVGHVCVVVVVVVVVDRCAIVVLLGVGQGLLGVVREVRHVVLALVARVVTLVGHGVIVDTVETAMVVRAVIEVGAVVVGVVVAVLDLVVSIVEVRIVVHLDVLGGV